MAGRIWTPDELEACIALEWDQFHERYPERSFDAYRIKRNRILAENNVVSFPDKHVPSFNWREASSVITAMQQLGRNASVGQDAATIRIDTDEPIGILFLSDVHIGDWATDYELFERITDEILSIPNLYVALLGDMGAMNIKMRGVAEVAGNLLPPELQLAFFESWLEEMADRIILSTWDNHAVEREEAGSGISGFKALQGRYVPYHNGIGHPDIVVGDELYKLAVSHRFRGRSATNPCAGPMKYLIGEAHDREIAAQGDSHVPGILQFTHGPSTKIAINTGTVQLHSLYARRHFSLTSHAVFPVLELHPNRHLAVPYWTVEAWMAARGPRPTDRSTEAHTAASTQEPAHERTQTGPAVSLHTPQSLSPGTTRVA